MLLALIISLICFGVSVVLCEVVDGSKEWVIIFPVLSGLAVIVFSIILVYKVKYTEIEYEIVERREIIIVNEENKKSYTELIITKKDNSESLKEYYILYLDKDDAEKYDISENSTTIEISKKEIEKLQSMP